MKLNRTLFALLLLLGETVDALQLGNDVSTIELRIHAPFNDLFDGEQDLFVLRMENHGRSSVPVPNGSMSSNQEYPPPQFQVQSEADAVAGKLPDASSWEKIVEFGNGGEIDGYQGRSVLLPGQAMEMTSWSASQLATPQRGGRFRVAMQVGSNEFVYSNWITRTKHAGKVPDLQVVRAVEPQVVGGLKEEFLISEGTQPRYLWYLIEGPANTLLIRICEVPTGIPPEIEQDRDRGQFVVRFSHGVPTPVYFGHRVGVSKKYPWPVNYRSKDFSFVPLSIRSPSPLEFPIALFQDSDKDQWTTFSWMSESQSVSAAMKQSESRPSSRLFWPIACLLVIGITFAAVIIARSRRHARM